MRQGVAANEKERTRRWLISTASTQLGHRQVRQNNIRRDRSRRVDAAAART
jgi:hypothetical protein